MSAATRRSLLRDVEANWVSGRQIAGQNNWIESGCDRPADGGGVDRLDRRRRPRLHERRDARLPPGGRQSAARRRHGDRHAAARLPVPEPARPAGLPPAAAQRRDRRTAAAAPDERRARPRRLRARRSGGDDLPRRLRDRHHHRLVRHLPLELRGPSRSTRWCLRFGSRRGKRRLAEGRRESPLPETSSCARRRRRGRPASR